jgi:hypothetical protein
MSAIATELRSQVPSTPRLATAPRAGKPRRRAFRRSEHARLRFVELDTPIAPQWEQRFWERYAIPGGIMLFWVVFTASNWSALGRILGDVVALLR